MNLDGLRVAIVERRIVCRLHRQFKVSHASLRLKRDLKGLASFIAHCPAGFETGFLSQNGYARAMGDDLSMVTKNNASWTAGPSSIDAVITSSPSASTGRSSTSATAHPFATRAIF